MAHRPLRYHVVRSIALIGVGVVSISCLFTPFIEVAAAEDPPVPSDSSAITQYRETIPTGGGGKAVGIGEARVTPLDPLIGQRIEARADPQGRLLEKIATSTDYGAPAQPAQTTPNSTSAKPALSQLQRPIGPPLAGDSSEASTMQTGSDLIVSGQAWRASSQRVDVFASSRALADQVLELRRDATVMLLALVIGILSGIAIERNGRGAQPAQLQPPPAP